MQSASPFRYAGARAVRCSDSMLSAQKRMEAMMEVAPEQTCFDGTEGGSRYTACGAAFFNMFQSRQESLPPSLLLDREMIADEED